MLPQEKSRLHNNPQNPAHSEAANPKLNVYPALTSECSTYINGDTVIQAFANHGLALNVNVFPVFNGQHLHQFAVYVERDSPGLDAEGDLVPAAVEQVADARVAEHDPDRVPGEPHRVVLQGFVLSIQPDRHLQGHRRGSAEQQSLLLLPGCFAPSLTPVGVGFVKLFWSYVSQWVIPVLSPD